MIAATVNRRELKGLVSYELNHLESFDTVALHLEDPMPESNGLQNIRWGYMTGMPIAFDFDEKQLDAIVTLMPKHGEAIVLVSTRRIA